VLSNKKYSPSKKEWIIGSIFTFLGIIYLINHLNIFQSKVLENELKPELIQNQCSWFALNILLLEAKSPESFIKWEKPNLIENLNAISKDYLDKNPANYNNENEKKYAFIIAFENDKDLRPKLYSELRSSSLKFHNICENYFQNWNANCVEVKKTRGGGTYQECINKGILSMKNGVMEFVESERKTNNFVDMNNVSSFESLPFLKNYNYY